LNLWEKEREIVLKAALKLVERGLIVGTAGNVSLRLIQDNGTELITITPTSRYYDTLTIDDIPVIGPDGKKAEGKLEPSSEIPMHTAIYRARKDVGAIIHTHSTYASAVAVYGLEIPPILEEEVLLLGGTIRVSRYARTGTIELANNAVAALEGRRATILANHGAVGVGRTMRDALDAAELVEKAAKVYLTALVAGRVTELSPEAVASAQAYFARNQSR
jgi:L-fuculose-phosphate aldolase